MIAELLQFRRVFFDGFSLLPKPVRSICEGVNLCIKEKANRSNWSRFFVAKTLKSHRLTDASPASLVTVPFPTSTSDLLTSYRELLNTPQTLQRQNH